MRDFAKAKRVFKLLKVCRWNKEKMKEMFRPGNDEIDAYNAIYGEKYGKI